MYQGLKTDDAFDRRRCTAKTTWHDIVRICFTDLDSLMHDCLLVGHRNPDCTQLLVYCVFEMPDF